MGVDMARTGEDMSDDMATQLEFDLFRVLVGSVYVHDR